MINYLALKKKEVMLLLKHKNIQQADADEIFSQISLLILEENPQVENKQEWLNQILKEKIQEYFKIKHQADRRGVVVTKDEQSNKVLRSFSLEKLLEQGIDLATSNPKEMIEEEELQILRENKINKLTKRQKLYYDLFARGLSVEEIMKELNVVERKVYQMRTKLQTLLKIQE